MEKHGVRAQKPPRICGYPKLRCRCGSSYRIFNWRKLKDGTPVFGYQCNMRTVNPTRSFVLEHNMTEQLSCDAISIPGVEAGTDGEEDF